MSDHEAVPSLNFHQHFRQQVSVLQEQVDSLSSPELSLPDRKTMIDSTLANIARLSSQLADAAGDLPSYDQRSYNQALKDLQDKLAITQASHAPKAKFSFKNRRLAPQSSEANSAATSRSITPTHLRDPERYSDRISPVPAIASPAARFSPEGDAREVPLEEEVPTISTTGAGSTHVLIHARRNAYLKVPNLVMETDTRDVLRGQSYVVSDITSSVVNLTPDSKLPAPPNLTLNRIEKSYLYAPNIKGPAHITGIQNGVLMISCRQFRMHDSHNVDVYLYCSSRPIIEDCSNIRFAKIPKKVSSDDQEQRSNMFNQVDDFKWLRAEHSPNWRLMQSDEELSDNTWTNVLEAMKKLDGDVIQELPSSTEPRAVQGILQMVRLGE